MGNVPEPATREHTYVPSPAEGPRHKILNSSCEEFFDEVKAMRTEDRWSQRAPAATGRRVKHCVRQGAVESAPPPVKPRVRSLSLEYGSIEDFESDTLSHQPRSTDDSGLPSLDATKFIKPTPPEPSMRRGWAREALAPALNGSPHMQQNADKRSVVCCREYAYYCTSRGMIPGWLSFTNVVLTFEPDVRSTESDFQCLISIADISEVACIVVPKTTAVENLFNLPHTIGCSDQPVWARHRSPTAASQYAAGENPSPSLALVQILLRQKKRRKLPPTGNATAPAIIEDGRPGERTRRGSASRVADMQPTLKKITSKDTTPASTTYVDDFAAVSASPAPPPLPRNFILFRVGSCIKAREVTRALLGLMKTTIATDGRSHFTYVPYFSHEALENLIRCSSIGQIDTGEPELPSAAAEDVEALKAGKLLRSSVEMIDSSGRRLDTSNEKIVEGKEIDDSFFMVSKEMLTELSYKLPPTVALRKWQLLFDTRLHGVSMQTLFLKTKDHVPALLCVLDGDGYVFGGYSGDGLRESRHFYGSGESFVFTFGQSRQLQTYHWTGKNDLFVYSNHDRIIFGSGGGSWAFAIDSNLLRGTSGQCATFGNELLTAGEDWSVRRIQVWGFESL